MKPAGLPRKVWIGNYEFPIALVARHTHDLGEDDGITHFNAPDRGIYIAEDLGTKELLETVFHELTHAFNFVGDLADFGDEDDEPVTASEEALATAHGKLWAQFWIDNPRFQAWHTRTINKIRKEMKEGG